MQIKNHLWSGEIPRKNADWQDNLALLQIYGIISQKKVEENVLT